MVPVACWPKGLRGGPTVPCGAFWWVMVKWADRIGTWYRKLGPGSGFCCVGYHLAWSSSPLWGGRLRDWRIDSVGIGCSRTRAQNVHLPWPSSTLRCGRPSNWSADGIDMGLSRTRARSGARHPRERGRQRSRTCASAAHQWPEVSLLYVLSETHLASAKAVIWCTCVSIALHGVLLNICKRTVSQHT